MNNQEEAKDFWVNKLGFIVKGEFPMGPDATWLEVGPSEDEFTTLVVYDKALMETKPICCRPSIHSFQHNRY